MSGFFLVRAEWAGVSLERATGNVPDDGKFHVVFEGRIVKSVRSERIARKAYEEAIEATGKQPPPKKEAESPAVSEILHAEDLHSAFHESAMYWGHSHRHTRGGGKGRQS